jgi:hypothetical protein
VQLAHSTAIDFNERCRNRGRGGKISLIHNPDSSSCGLNRRLREQMMTECHRHRTFGRLNSI